MIEDVIVSIGRVGTQATADFLKTAPDIVPTSWFDVADIHRHWDSLDALPRRVVVMLHHSRHLPLLDRIPNDRLRVTWNTRCPFASARSCVNWRVFQNIVVNGGVPTRTWRDLLDPDDLQGFYPAVARALRNRAHQIIDLGEYAPGRDSGYRRLAAHHRLPIESMDIPQTQVQGLFETFLCGHRFRFGSFSYQIIPAQGATWEDNDLYLGDVVTNQVFPHYYDVARTFSVYVVMGRPDNQWKRKIAWEVFQENLDRLEPLAQSVFDRSKDIFEEIMVQEDNPDLTALVRDALGRDLDRLMAEYPVFGQNWRPPQ